MCVCLYVRRYRSIRLKQLTEPEVVIGRIGCLLLCSALPHFQAIVANVLVVGEMEEEVERVGGG